jgi:ribonuclease HI
MKDVTIYTDGACSGNPGPGGWGAVMVHDDYKKGISGFSPATTNNRMELSAVIESLRALLEPCKVTVYSDSAYVVSCFKHKWHENWIANGWRNSQKKKVENRELWEELLFLMTIHDVSYAKVKGHAGVELNEWADQLAREAIKRGA